MKIISIGTLKGGVGKSEAVFNIAGKLAEQGKKVLVIDNDPQANSTSNFGLDETVDGFLGIDQIYENNIEINKVIVKKPIEELPTLDIIPSSIELTRTEMKMINEAARELILKKYFKTHATVLSTYDIVLIDTNPSMSVINQNVFMVSDSVILVTDVGMNGLKGIQLFTALWEEILNRFDIESNIKAVVVNQYRSNIKMHQEFLEYLKEDDDIKDILIDTTIPLNIKLSESELENKPINIYAPSSAGGKAYKKLVEELERKDVL